MFIVCSFIYTGTTNAFLGFFLKLGDPKKVPIWGSAQFFMASWYVSISIFKGDLSNFFLQLIETPFGRGNLKVFLYIIFLNEWPGTERWGILLATDRFLHRLYVLYRSCLPKK